MPFARVNVKHNFGIFSHSHLAILERRLQESYYCESGRSTARSIKSVEKALDDIEGFIKACSKCEPEAERASLDAEARKIILKIQRFCGLKPDLHKPLVGEENTNICGAWIKLSQLLQCRGPVLNDCTDILLQSLDATELSTKEIIVLFFVLETILFIICHKADQFSIDKALLWRLLSVSHLVCLRLHCHHISGYLSNRFLEQKINLKKFLQGTKKNLLDLCCDNPLYQSIICFIQNVIENIIRSEQEQTNTAVPTSNLITDSYRKSLLHHSHDTWRHFTARGEWKSLSDKIRDHSSFPEAKSACFTSLPSNWIDDYCALGILSQTAILDLNVLIGLQSLAAAAGVNTEHSSNQSSSVIGCHQLSRVFDWPDDLAVLYVNLLADVVINGSTSTIRRHALIGYDSVEDYIGVGFPKYDNRNSHLVSLAMIKRDKTWQHQQSGESSDRWKVRFAAVQSLVKIYQYYNKSDKETASINSGITTAVFTLIEHGRALERDRRVLSAYKLGGISLKPVQHLFKNMAKVFDTLTSCDIVNDTARNSACHSLIISHDDILETQRSQKPKSSTESWNQFTSSLVVQQKITSKTIQEILQENIKEVPAAYNERTRNQLVTMVHDQFQKELQKKAETIEEKELIATANSSIDETD